MKVTALLFLLAFLLIACDDQDQNKNDFETEPPILKAHTIQVSEVVGGYYCGLPVQYEKTLKRYPVIVCMHGAGQYGDGNTQLHNILNEAIPELLQQKGFPPSFTVQGVNYSFIILAPQFSTHPTNAQVLSFISYAKEKYRIDTSRVYLTGFSEGGRIACNAAAAFPRQFAALVAIAGVSKPEDVELNCRNIANNNLPVWVLHNEEDQLMDANLSRDFVLSINSFNPSIAARYTEFLAYGLWNHDAWTKATDPTFKEEGMSIYEWMLQFKR